MIRKTKETKVTLLSWTRNPVETIYCQWQQSRTEGPVMEPDEISVLLDLIHKRTKLGTATDQDTKFAADVRDTFRKVISMKIPVAETINFVFMLEHCPIALREQIVRHRIGHRYGGQLGADIVPDLSESTFWSQTTRVLNMGKFASEGEYLLPESVQDPTKKIIVRGKETTVEEFYHEQMGWIQSAYNRLIEAGVPVEDARNLLPLATQHRLTWSMNLSSLMHVLSKRGCWIAQLGMWEPVIRGIVEEISTKVDPDFRMLIDPPCIGSDGKFKSCVFKLENENRVSGEDPYAPCPLYLHRHSDEAVKVSELSSLSNRWSLLDGLEGNPAWAGATPNAAVELLVRGKKYENLWHRDMWTGVKFREMEEPKPC